MNIIIPGLIAALAVWPPLLAKDDAAGTAASAVDFYARVTGVREVGVGGARPGLHLDAKVNGRNTDIYVAPINYLEQYGMTFGKGDDVHVIGSRTRLAGGTWSWPMKSRLEWTTEEPCICGTTVDHSGRNKASLAIIETE